MEENIKDYIIGPRGRGWRKIFNTTFIQKMVFVVFHFDSGAGHVLILQDMPVSRSSEKCRHRNKATTLYTIVERVKWIITFYWQSSSSSTEIYVIDNQWKEHQIICLLLAVCKALGIRRHSIAIQSPIFPLGVKEQRGMSTCPWNM